MKLTDLDAEFIRWEERIEPYRRVAPGFDPADPNSPIVEVVGPVTYMPRAESLAEAQGVEFECPKCGGHHIVVAFADRGVAEHHGSRDSQGRPTRWQVVSGTGLDDLTLSPSIDCTPSNPDCWHGFITNGEAT